MQVGKVYAPNQQKISPTSEPNRGLLRIQNQLIERDILRHPWQPGSTVALIEQITSPRSQLASNTNMEGSQTVIFLSSRLPRESGSIMEFP